MTSTLGFWISLVATVLLLALSVWSGFGGRRRFHLWSGPLSLVGLALAIVFTEQLIRSRVFPAREMGIHLFFAIGGAALAVPVLISGVALAFRPQLRRVHRYCVFAFLLMVLVAAGTGIWVFALSTPKPL